MKHRFAIPFLLIAALGLSGCQFADKVKDFVGTTITNPITPTNLYQAKLAFAASQELVKKYQRDCFGSLTPPYPVSFAVIQRDPTLSVQCSHRVSRYNAAKSAEDKANNAILRADTFILQNPSGNAVSYISAAIKAVIDYQAKVGG